MASKETPGAEELANYRRRLKALVQHHDNRDADGKSADSVSGGHIAGRAAADADRDFGQKLAARRWNRDGE